MKFHIFKDGKGEFRWRLRAANGKTIADSGEGYKDEKDCRAGIALVQSASTAPIEVDKPAKK